MQLQKEDPLPLAKIHVVEGHYDQTRMAKAEAIQAALMNTLHVPPEDFYQLIFEHRIPRSVVLPNDNGAPQ
jgi:hypothetical protein